jgi:phosphoadenosine phosphosulfate reductase
MLYALYKFAEKCGGYWEFPLSRLMDFTVEAEGVSPAQIFALSRDEVEAILNGLARTNPDFVTFTTTHDLELVRLSDDKTSADVLKLLNGGSPQ